MEALSPAFANVLRSARPELNARFAAARRARPELEGEAFAAFLRDTVDPLVRAVDGVSPDRVADVALAAYDLGLDLVGQGLAGPGAREAAIDEGWRTVAPAAAALVAAAPERVLASLSNALHQLAATPGARPREWIAAMAALAAKCTDPTVFLRLGQVAAWRAGMAHFRQGALAAADALPEPLALEAVGARGGAWAEVRGRLRADAWHDPARPGAEAAPRVVARAGAFRGFGGLFTEPPHVGAAGDHFVVASGGECWLLTADAFGATFHRATPGDLAHPQPAGLPDGVALDAGGVTVRGARCELPELGEVTSTVAIGGTLALTSALTHSVVLISLS